MWFRSQGGGWDYELQAWLRSCNSQVGPGVGGLVGSHVRFGKCLGLKWRAAYLLILGTRELSPSCWIGLEQGLESCVVNRVHHPPQVAPQVAPQ